MKMTYNAEVDILHMRLEGAQVRESDEVEEGVVLDYDEAGQVVGMEIQDAFKHVGALKTASMIPEKVDLSGGRA